MNQVLSPELIFMIDYDPNVSIYLNYVSLADHDFVVLSLAFVLDMALAFVLATLPCPVSSIPLNRGLIVLISSTAFF